MTKEQALEILKNPAGKTKAELDKAIQVVAGAGFKL